MTEDLSLNDVPGTGSFTKELSLHGLTPDQYLSHVRRAARGLGWRLASVTNDTITCHTLGAGDSLGAYVSISVGPSVALFQSRAMNEYYPGGDQGAKNADRYEAALAKVIGSDRRMEQRLTSGAGEKYGALALSKTYMITPLLMYVNTAIFICMVLSGLSPIEPSVQGLYAWGGDFRAAVMGGQVWRLVTHMFLHGGVPHLLFNMFALLYIGTPLEPLLGRFRFTAAYLLAGVCGGLMSIVFHPNSVGVGASGAIFGLYGVFLAMLTTPHIQKTLRKTMLRSILFFVLYNLLYGLQGNTDNAAHIGGLLSGLVIGYAYYPGVRHHAGMGKQALVTGVLCAGVAALTIYAMVALPR